MRKIIVIALLLFSTAAVPQTSAQKLHWRTINSPTQEDIHYAKRLNKKLGYIYNKSRRLFKFEKDEWHEMSLPRGVLTDQVFVAGEEDIWAVVQPVDQYRQQIMYYEKGQWLQVRMPNIDVIKTIFFESPHSGWAGCTWGEILRFKDGEWRQIYSPTRCHIENFIKGVNGDFFALTDCASGGSNQVLLWRAGSWEILIDHHPSAFHYGLVTESGDLWLWDSKSLYAWDGEKLIINAAHPPIHRIALFPQGDGYLFTPDRAFYFSSFLEKRKTPISIVDLKNVRGITLTEDGSGWLFGNEGKLWELDEGPQEMRPAELHFITHVGELGKIMGSAVLQINSGKRDLYIVEHEKPNILVRHVEQKTDLLQPVIPGRMHHLDEPQKNTSKAPVYDFAVLAGDFNGDRKEDIFLTSLYGSNCLFLNLDKEKFINATDWAGLKTPGGRYGIAATADIDNDGDLDLFVPDEMGRSKLYLNDGYARFTDEAALRGALVPYAAKASCFGDIDADGWVDLAVTTYQNGTYLFRNLGQGYFQDMSAKSPSLNPAQPEKCSSLAFADYDNDGDLDLFLCKMLASNTLLLNDGQGSFTDVTREAGLLDSSLSRGAVFFDPDHDGDLDMYISNMGHDAFYINNGQGKFVLNANKMQFQPSSWLPSEYVTNLAGAISNGAVVLDYGGDGDPDLFVGRFDARSILFSNEYNRGDYLIFRLFGTSANYSAVGATVRLYPAGKNFDPNAILGARIIESTSGYGSHSEKWLHFGVDSLQKYDAEILFPGGERILLQNLKPGQSYRIEELQGWQYLYEVVRNHVLNYLFGFRSDLRHLYMLLFGFLIIPLLLLKKRVLLWDPTVRFILPLGFLFGFLPAHQLYVYQSDLYFFIVPLFAGCVSAAVSTFAWRAWRFRNMPQATFQALSLKLAGFSHSENYANVLASLELHLNNMQQDEPVDEGIVERCRHAIRIVKEQMNPEIREIVAFFRTLKFQVERAFALHAAWRRLLALLRKFGKGLEKQHAPALVVADQLKAVLHEVKMHVRSLQREVAKKESTDLASTITQFIETHQNNNVRITAKLKSTLPPIHFSTGEIHTILDELVANALHAMQHSTTKEITFEALETTSAVILEVHDSGSGIPAERWPEIFQRRYTTKTHGGLGLYMAKRIMERYNGDIQVKKSSQDGTTFTLHFRKAE